MSYEVLLTGDALRDLDDIYHFIAVQDGIPAADQILEKLEATCSSLADLPGRGNVPKELQELGITEFRELHFKPYRIFYRLMDDKVVVHSVLDGRREMQSLLLRRLIR